MRIIGYVIYDIVSKQFISRDNDSGGYPYKSETPHTTWSTYSQARNYRDVPGFESHGSENWRIHPIQVDIE